MATSFNSHLLKNLLIQKFRQNNLSRTFHRSAMNMIKVGEAIPSVDLYEGLPGNAVNIATFCKDKKVVLFGVPGAFTPGCTRSHLPGYVDRYMELKKKGIDEVVCVSVNDAFVMEAWGKIHDTTGKIKMFADPDATFTKTLGMDVSLPKLGGIRSKRYSMVIKDGIVQILNVEPDGTGLSCSLAKKLVV